MYGKKSRYGRLCVISIVLVLVALWQWFVSKANDNSYVKYNDISTIVDDLNDERIFGQWESHVSSRHLLGLVNCTPRAVDQFPRSFFTQEQRIHGAITIHIIIVIYMFLALAIVCDYYFVPSLEIICEYLHLESDVAGATFMAAGSSAPELATAVIGVFVAKDDVGLGTVVGSAIYNVMFVISICAFFAGSAVYLTWWPMVRDCFAYTVSIIALIVVIYDEEVRWYEAGCLCLLYVLYIILMYYNSRLEVWCVPKCSCFPNKNHQLGPESIILYDKVHTNSNGSTNHTDAGHIGEMLPLTSDCESEESGSDIEHDYYQRKAEAPKSEEPEPLCQIPSGILKILFWIISLPLCTILCLTTPDCRKERWKNWFVVTFIVSLAWLSAFSFIMVWMITVIGYTVDIPDSIMGLTFIAFGVSLPDVIASVIVVKEGLGDMAVSNAVGSNVFDILICLGVPWLIQTTAMKPGGVVKVYSKGLTYSSVTLLSTVVFLLVATHVNGWKLDKKYGVVLLIVYVFYTILASLYECNIFGYLHPEECPSDY